MKKVNTFLVSLSIFLMAQIADASWSVGGFVGQSNGRSLIDCQGGELPITTLTTSTIEEAFLNQEAIDTALDGTPQSVFSNQSFVDQLQGEPQIIIDSGILVSIEFPDAVDINMITTSDTFVGTPEGLGFETVSTVFSAPDLGPINSFSGSFTSVPFDATDFGDFLSGATPGGGTFITALEESFIPTTATSSGALVTQSLASFECNNDQSDFSYSINVAYHFNKHWGIEFGYADLGEFSSSLSAQGFDITDPPARELDASAFYLAVSGTHYYNKNGH